MNTRASTEFWRGKRVFITSPTSFLGAWTVLSLKFLGAEVFGFGEASAESPNLFDISNLALKTSMTYGDLRNLEALREALNFAQADVVLHLGESGFLHDQDREAPELFARSVVGTANLCELLKDTASVRGVVVVSSDKVYGKNREAEAASESSVVVPLDVLPTARLCAEFVALSYRHSYFNPDKYNKHKLAIATARLGSAVGGGDFNPRSLVYESISAEQRGEKLELRNPNSQRSWISVLDQVNGILLLAEKLIERGPKCAPTYNLGAEAIATVAEAIRHAGHVRRQDEQARQYELARHSEQSEESPTTTTVSKHNTLNNTQAKTDLNWQPQTDLKHIFSNIAPWYQAYYQGNVEEATAQQLREYFT